MIALDTFVEWATKLEGPYKWYAIGTVILALTALITRFIFKTLKWFFIIMAVGVLVLAIVTYVLNT